MSGIYLDTDPYSGAVETLSVDEMSGDFAIHRTADVQPIIDANKEWENHVSHVRTPGDLDMRLAARIPIEVAYLWLQRYGICAWKKEHWDKVKRLLNDGEWRYLRTNNLIL